MERVFWNGSPRNSVRGFRSGLGVNSAPFTSTGRRFGRRCLPDCPANSLSAGPTTSSFSPSTLRKNAAFTKSKPPPTSGASGNSRVGDQQLQAFDDPLAAVVVVFARERVHSEQIRTSAATTPAVINPRLVFSNDFAVRTSRHPWCPRKNACAEPTTLRSSINKSTIRAPRPARNVAVCLLFFLSSLVLKSRTITANRNRRIPWGSY